MKITITLGLILVVGSLLVSPASAQQSDCDACQEVSAGWVTCVFGGGKDGTGCHQHEPDHCDYTGSCDPQFALADVTVGGSVSEIQFQLVSDEMITGFAAIRRICDAAVLRRYVTDRELRRRLRELRSLSI